MATEIGIVKALIGTAVITAVDGSQRNLLVGDRVYADEVITTGDASAIEIEFSDGSLMDLGRNSQALLDSEIFDPQQAIASNDDVDIAALQNALVDGEDPTQEGEAPAAGPESEGNNEGVTTVVVDYLDPTVEVTSGFETTGVARNFLSEDNLFGDTEDNAKSENTSSINEPPLTNEPPIADEVRTTSDLVTDIVPLGFPVDSAEIAFFKALNVGGGLDGDLSIIENNPNDPADLGGQDLETAETNLIFNIESLPDYGDVYVYDGSSYTKIDADNLGAVDFSTAGEVYWIATHSQVPTNGLAHNLSFTEAGYQAGLAAENITIKGYGLDGNDATISFSSTDGLGIDSSDDRINQLEFADGKSETLLFDFEHAVTNATIGTTHLIKSEGDGEIGVVTAYLDGVAVGSWTFTASATATADFSPSNGNFTDQSLGGVTGNQGGTFTLVGVVFDQLQFTGTEYENQNGTQDSSDYYVASLSYNDIDANTVNFQYSVTDEDSQTSPLVDVVIDVNTQTDTPVPATMNSYVDLSTLTFGGWQSGQDQGTAAVNDNVLSLTGNAWKSVALSDLGVDNTFDWANGSLTFEIKTTAPGEIQGVLFDSNLTQNDAVDTTNMFKVFGSQSWGTGAFTSDDLGDGWFRIEIDLSALNTTDGVPSNLIFVNDDDSGVTGAVSFRNLSISDNTTDLMLEGDASDNILVGLAGEDILIGGGGNDILTGGDGDDIFIWNASDVGTVATPAHDEVTDFDASNDVLNLADLLSDGSHTIEGIQTGAGDLQLNIKDGSGGIVQEIELHGVSVTTTATQLVDDLLSSGAINDGI